MNILSLDIETNGHLPGKNSMLSIAILALDATGSAIDAYEANLQPIAGGVEDVSTMEWWKGFPQAYQKATENQRDIVEVVCEVLDFVAKNAPSVYLAYNSHYDMAFMNHYVRNYTTQPRPMLHCIELRDIVMLRKRLPHNLTAKRYWQESWFAGFDKDEQLAHTAMYDAAKQAYLYFQLI